MKNHTSGFTYIELLIAIVILSIVAAISIGAYLNYERSAETVDALATVSVLTEQIGVIASTNQGDKVTCDDSLAGLGGLENPYLSLSIVPTPLDAADLSKGYGAAILVSAAFDQYGTEGIAVAKALYKELSAQNTDIRDLVDTDSIVTFTALLPPGQAICNLPAGQQIASNHTSKQPTQTSTSSTQSVTPPIDPATGLTQACTVTPGQKVNRQVMVFGEELTGAIINDGDLDTGGGQKTRQVQRDLCKDEFLGDCKVDFDGMCGDEFVDNYCSATCGVCTLGEKFETVTEVTQISADMKQFSAEVAILGGKQIPASGGHGATILSYATRSSQNEFLIWNPDSLTIMIKGTDIDTGINVNDGLDHRITTTFDSDTGSLTVYDNGKQQFQTITHKGELVGGSGKLVLGQDQDTYGGGFQKSDAYQGDVVAASLARTIPTPAEIAAGPLQTRLDKNHGLITTMVLGPDGRPIDPTGQNTYTTQGSVIPVNKPVDTALFANQDCS